MRVAHLSASSSPRAGGVGAYVARVVDLLRRAGHEVYVLHEDAGLDDPFPGPADRIAALAQLNPQPLELTARALNLVRAFRPDVVHLHDVNNLRLVRALNAEFPVVRSAHNHAQQCPAGRRLIDFGSHVCEKPFGPLCLPYMAVRRCHPSRNPAVLLRLFRYAQALNALDRELPLVCAASRFVYREMAASGFAEGQLELLPYFTSLPAADASSSDSPSRNAGEKTILFTGRIVQEKGLGALLEALSTVRSPWRLVVDGAGPAQREAERTAKANGIAERVTFRGWCPPGPHEANYRRADVVVVPSLWPEPFGLVGIEAMSYAKPVVAFAVGGIMDWLEDGVTGFGVQRGDTAAMGARIQTLLEDEALARQMGRAGRERVAALYSPEAHLLRLLAVYERLFARCNDRQRPS